MGDGVCSQVEMATAKKPQPLFEKDRLNRQEGLRETPLASLAVWRFKIVQFMRSTLLWFTPPSNSHSLNGTVSRLGWVAIFAAG
jgi:hypothetical protein